MVVGIIGHRDLSKKDTYKYKKNILNILKYLQKQNIDIKVISPLADGADRLAVYQAIRLNITFEAVLPMNKCDYKKDFEYYSKKVFDLLLKKANTITTLTYKEDVSRNFKYESVGKYISDNCDILIALWDGKYNDLQGGTSDILKYHLKNKKAFYHIKVDRNIN